MTLKTCRKAIAQHLGLRGNAGGWICRPTGKPICQGWDVLETSWIRRGWIVFRGEPYGYRIDWREVPDPDWMQNGTPR